MSFSVYQVKNNFMILSFLAISILATGCGKIDWVKDAKVSAYKDTTNDLHGVASVYLNTGNVQMIAFNVPIVDPRNPSLVLGSIMAQAGNFTDHNNANNLISIDVNVSNLIHIPSQGTGALLPNGTQLPVAGFTQDEIYTFNVTGLGIKAYVGLDVASKDAMFGVAIPISQFKLPVSGNLFLPFNLANGIIGNFGFFTGTSNGIGLFVNTSNIMQTTEVNSLLSQNTVLMNKTTVSQPKQFLEVRADAKTEEAIGKMVYKLNNKKATLTAK